MRHTKTTLGLAIAVAFATGIVVSPLVHRAIPDAHAAAAPLTPAVIDLAALKHADLPATPNPEQHSKTLIVTDNATLAIQTGNVGKHIHRTADEIQYIIEGSGSMWLGSEQWPGEGDRHQDSAAGPGRHRLRRLSGSCRRRRL